MAAAESGAKLRTIWAWKLIPEFNRRVNELRSDIISQSLGRLVDNVCSAIDTLGFLSRKARSEMVRVIAASKIIDSVIKVRELAELEQKVAALESERQGRVA
jgi:hypothetical protein